MKINIMLRLVEILVMGGILTTWVLLIPHPNQPANVR